MASLTDGINEMSLGNSGGGEVPTNVAHRNEMATCKIKTLTGSGTGTLIKINDMFCVLTNNHVLPAEETANGSKAHFEDLQGIQTNVQICPDQFFVTDEELDFTFVAISGQPMRKKISEQFSGESKGLFTSSEIFVDVPFEHIEFINRSRVEIGATVSIFQHPRGESKKMAMGNVVKLLGKFVKYNFSSFGQLLFPIEKMLSECCLNELKFCKVSRNPKSKFLIVLNLQDSSF